MKEELEDSLKKNGYSFEQLITQDIEHIDRYPIDDIYQTIIIQSANAIKKIDSSNNHIFNTKKIYGIGPNCKYWVEKKFGCKCIIPDEDFSSNGLIEKINADECDLGKTLLLKGEGGKLIINKFLDQKKIKYTVKNVYRRVINQENIIRVKEKINKEIVVIAFSRSSIEPIIKESKSLMANCHCFVLDKSDEEIISTKDVLSLSKIDDIYDIEALTKKIIDING